MRSLDWIPASAGMTNFSAADGKLTHYYGAVAV
jgi:hypothetical protein